MFTSLRKCIFAITFALAIGISPSVLPITYDSNYYAVDALDKNDTVLTVNFREGNARKIYWDI
jgi:hypothetical protein